MSSIIRPVGSLGASWPPFPQALGLEHLWTSRAGQVGHLVDVIEPTKLMQWCIPTEPMAYLRKRK